jgi:hypothetical protein
MATAAPAGGREALLPHKATPASEVDRGTVDGQTAGDRLIGLEV